MKLVLTRLTTIGNGTVGTLIVPGLSYPLWTLEDLPKDNAPRISCIPAGDYKCAPHGWKSEPVKFRKVWEVLDVPQRSAILFHAGNSHLDTQGCILVGLGMRGGQLTHSRNAIDVMREAIGPNGFDLQIVDRALL